MFGFDDIGIAVGGGLLGGATNGFSDWDPRNWGSNLGNNVSNLWDKFKNGVTNSTNKKIAKMNYDAQMQALDYNKALNEQLMNREDTAYQRTVNDMRSAGLNPMMMNETNGSGGSIAPITAPEMNYQHQDKGLMQAITEIFGAGNALQDYQIGEYFGQEQQAKAEIAKADATIKQNEALISSETTKDKLEDMQRNYSFNKDSGTWNGMDDRTREAFIYSAKDAEIEDARNKTAIRTYQDTVDSPQKLTELVGKGMAQQIVNKAKEYGKKGGKKLDEWLNKDKKRKKK